MCAHEWCLLRRVEFPGCMREPHARIHLAFRISTVKSRDVIHICPLFLMLLAPSRNPVPPRISQTERGIELGEMRREGRCPDPTGSWIKPVVGRDYVVAHAEPKA